jgi:hypothetical protein
LAPASPWTEVTNPIKIATENRATILCVRSRSTSFLKLLLPGLHFVFCTHDAVPIGAAAFKSSMGVYSCGVPIGSTTGRWRWFAFAKKQE